MKDCKHRLTALLVSFLLAAFAAGQNATAFPRIEGETFAGQHIVIPDSTSGKVIVLVFGFSKNSKTQTGEWRKKLSADFASQNGFQFYELPVLEDVPRLFRGMVISGIKKGTPENDRDHFVPVMKGEAELKNAVHFKESDDAYIVVLDRSGKVVQEVHGAPDNLYSSFRQQVTQLLNQK